jgi:hypothetical protein
VDLQVVYNTVKEDLTDLSHNLQIMKTELKI